VAVPKPPDDLADGGRRLWRQVVAVYELTASERVLLHEAARTADECERTRVALVDAPAFVAGAKGQPKPQPLLNEARQHRATLVRLVGALALPDDPADLLVACRPRAVMRSGRRGRVGIGRSLCGIGVARRRPDTPSRKILRLLAQAAALRIRAHSPYRHLWYGYDAETVEAERAAEMAEADKVDPQGLTEDLHVAWRVVQTFNRTRDRNDPSDHVRIGAGRCGASDVTSVVRIAPAPLVRP
jgi:hypothetical protein